MADGMVAPVDSPATAASADPLLRPGGRYVVGFDGSQASRSALTWAASRASAAHHPLMLAAVLVGGAGGNGPDAAADRLEGLLSDAADRITRTWPGLSVSARTVRGEVAAALVAATRGSDILVIGSDKTGYARGRLYGFRSLQLAASAVAIAVVPAVDLRLRAGVLVGVADIPDILELVRIGAREAAQKRGSRLVLVHAAGSESAASQARAEELLDSAVRAAIDERPGLHVIRQMLHRPAPEAILNATRDKSLLLLGHSRDPGALGVGGTLHSVLMNANVPIVVML